VYVHKTLLKAEIESLIDQALAEDVGDGDLTTEALVEPGRGARARIERKEAGVIFGLEIAEAVFRRLDPALDWQTVEAEGAWHDEAPAVVTELAGDARALLTGERVALNFLAHLSGIATLTARCVRELRGTGVQLLDTRKTTPGLRRLEKRAVAAGGGTNHRLGLHDAMLVKENHVALAGGVGEATRRALARRPEGVMVEVECRTLLEVEEALDAGAERLLLDNMSPADLRRAFEIVAGRAELEASGGITPDTLREVAEAGVQFISLGVLTHSAPALDLSMSTEPLA
jgi:nicotinate-nucleotide pyrophosphorylase (carboxylating)